MSEISNSWHTYPSIHALGHKALEHLLDSSVYIEEKIDGSQLSFGLIEGQLRVRSKGQDLIVDAPEKLFAEGVSTIKEIAQLLHPEWTYRAEYLKKPKHNTLAYDRIPNKHLIIFDINDGHESYLGYGAKSLEAERLGFETVPLIMAGIPEGVDDILKMLEKTSVLGGSLIEGVVLKNYKVFGQDGKVLMAKLVSERFKEVHGGEWRKNNPTTLDIISQLIAKYQTPARWDKAIIHLRERGELEDDPRDIGKLLKEISIDVLKEEEPEIKDALFKYAWPKIQRGIIRGFPEFYKELLASKQFEK